MKESEFPVVTSSDKRQALRDVATTNGGKITANLVVDAAKDPSNALNSEFEWDDTQAAHEYRLYTARILINRYRVVIKHTDTSGVVTRHSVKEWSQNEEHSAWEPTVEILSDPDRAGVLLNRLRDKARNLSHEIDNYTAVAGSAGSWFKVRGVIEEVLDEDDDESLV